MAWVFCYAFEALLALIDQRSRPKHTLGAVVSSMTSLKNIALSAQPLHSSLPMTPSSLAHTPSLPLQFDSLPLLYTLTALSPLVNTVSFFLGLLFFFFFTMLLG